MNMHNMRHYIYIIALCLLSGSSIYGQTQKAFLKAADEAYENKNYYGALKWYTEALDFEEDDPALIYKVAESARNFESYDIAAEKYQLLADSLGSDAYPDATYHLGDMLYKLGKYDEAKRYYNMYLSEYSGTDSLLTIAAKNDLESVEFAISRQDDIDKSADIIEVEAEVNTPYSEFGAIKRGETLYFTTMKYAEKASENYPPRSISKIHKMEDDLNQVIEGDLNESDQLIAHTTFSSDGSMMYYTICDYINDEDVRCDLYSRFVNEDGSMGTATKLPAPMNMDAMTNTQPQVSFDSTEMKDVLYFVSDRDGGAGQLDIYRAVINNNGSFGQPTNVVELNTTGNDVTPFFNTKSNTLYFSSDGRQGLGGYDIYFANGSTGGFEDVTHMRMPVNSSYHDLYYTINSDETEAYYSTNRAGATYVDETLKACCFDIYKVEYDEVIIDLNALVFDEFTKDPLSGATAILIDAITGDTIKALTNEEGNDFYFKVKRDHEYNLHVSRPFYNSQVLDISTAGITESTVIDKKVYLKTDRMQLDIETFNKRTQEELAGVQIVLKNLTTGQVDTIALNEMGNDFHLYPELGYKYEIEASKFGFVTEREIIDLTNVSEPGLIEKKMYLEVFDIEDYMPVIVYFDNDYPNPRSKSADSDKIYGNLFDDYMREKSSFIKNYTKKLPSTQRAEGASEIDNFFEGDVVGGYDKLKRFMRALKKELQLGRSLDIAIKGYASPIADTRYNLALGQRRVSSVENEILNYEGGIFREYVQSGKLIITDISFGEETSPAGISDKASEKSRSVYGVDASRERRVQIVKISDQ